jgi:hypothetical protein
MFSVQPVGCQPNGADTLSRLVADSVTQMEKLLTSMIARW